MRIAFFHHYSLTHGGGGERFLLELSGFLADRGHDVEIHALPFRRRDVKLEMPPGVSYCEDVAHRAEADVAYHMYAPLVSEVFRCRAPRIAGLHGAVVADYASPAGFYLRQGPFVAGAYLVRQAFGSTDLSRFDAIHTVSPVPLDHPRRYVLPNWVDCSNTERALELKRERSETFNVLYVGKPSYTKGFDRVTELSRALHGSGFEFWVAAPPDPQLDSDGLVKWLGYVPHEHIWEVYAKSAVLLHPTRQETFGRAILESVAAGTPVVTTPIASHVAMGLPLEFAASVPEMRMRLESLHRAWESDYDGYRRTAHAIAGTVARFDRRTVLPLYEKMLVEVSDRGAS